MHFDWHAELACQPHYDLDPRQLHFGFLLFVLGFFPTVAL